MISSKEIFKRPQLLFRMLVDLIPVLGVVVWGWSIKDIVILFWWESGLVVAFALLGLYILLRKNKNRTRELRREMKISNLYFVVFILLSMLLSYVLFKSGTIESGLSLTMIYTAGLLLIRDLLNFLKLFSLKKEGPIGASRNLARSLWPNFNVMIVFIGIFLVPLLVGIGSSGDFFLYITLFLLVGSQLFTDIEFFAKEEGLNR